MAYTIIRGGWVLDIRAGTAEPADILIEDDTIREIGPPGCSGARGGARDLGGAAADPSRPRQCPYPLARQSRQGDGRPLDPRIAARRGAVDRRQPHRRRPPSVGADRRGRDGAEGLHRAVRSVFRMAGADPRRHRVGRLGLCRSRHARGDRADGRRPQLLRGDPRSRRRPAARAAGARRGAAPARPARRRWRRSATRCTTGRSTATISARPSRRRSRIIARTNSSSAAPRWRAISMSGCTAMSPSRRCRPWPSLRLYGSTQTAHLDRLGVLGPHFTVAHGVWLDHDDMARLGDKGASVAHNPGSNMRLGSGLADTRGMLDRAGQSRDRHRRRVVLRQSEHVRGDAARLVRLEGAGAGMAALADDRARRRSRRPRAAPACSASTASAGSRRAGRPIS